MQSKYFQVLISWVKGFYYNSFHHKASPGSSGLTHITSALQQQSCQQSSNSGREFHLLSNSFAILSMPQP